jgi:hypothetical protein
MIKGPVSVPRVLVDPDPGGPKTYGTLWASFCFRLIPSLKEKYAIPVAILRVTFSCVNIKILGRFKIAATFGKIILRKCQCCGIRIRRIHMFFGLPDPDPLVRDTDPDSDPSIIKQK